ncbi:RNA polymerase sigma factor [Alteromonas sp. a30]|uniref:RNA polymerase sigma factor n=1 Tax=Alteromonas sp. a30 TaxID=2730917 RepID=UPI002282C26B|nr:RNA polymerase sigma factor [Alteromonas sp. a30]MCY7297331.1 RNA polymerase sigma factor [Alteromonas sp. a30]
MDNKIHDTYMTARKGVMKMVSRIVPPKEVEDIVQETYVRLCQIEAPQTILEPRSFLYRTAKNLALDHLKKAETRLADAVDDSDESLSDSFNGSHDNAEDSTFKTVVSQQEFEHFCESVRFLPVQCRKAFVLKKVYGYSQKEIAKTMQITESTVEKHIAMGIKKCTQYMMQTQGAGTNESRVKEAFK